MSVEVELLKEISHKINQLTILTKIFCGEKNEDSSTEKVKVDEGFCVKYERSGTKLPGSIKVCRKNE